MIEAGCWEGQCNGTVGDGRWNKVTDARGSLALYVEQSGQAYAMCCNQLTTLDDK